LIYLVDLSDLSDRRLCLLHLEDQWVQLCLYPGYLEDLTGQLDQLNRELKYLVGQWDQSDQRLCLLHLQHQWDLSDLQRNLPHRIRPAGQWVH